MKELEQEIQEHVKNLRAEGSYLADFFEALANIDPDLPESDKIALFIKAGEKLTVN